MREVLAAVNETVGGWGKIRKVCRDNWRQHTSKNTKIGIVESARAIKDGFRTFYSDAWTDFSGFCWNDSRCITALCTPINTYSPAILTNSHSGKAIRRLAES